MNDLISKAAALDAIDGMTPMIGNVEQLAMKALCWAAVKSIQPVDAVLTEDLRIRVSPSAKDAFNKRLWGCLKIVESHERRAMSGRWIETTIPANTTGHGGVGQDKKKGWLCSKCRCAFDAKLLWCDNYCPNCGAKMDGEWMENDGSDA